MSIIHLRNTILTNIKLSKLSFNNGTVLKLPPAAMPCLLSSKAQSFSPQFFTNEQNCNLFLLPLKLENENYTNILMLHGSQVVLFDSKDLTVKEEIILESQIEAFQFEQNELTLKLRNKDEIKTNELSTSKITDNTCTTDTRDTTDNVDIITDTSNVISDTTSTTSSFTNSALTTITSKNCTWTLSSPIFTLTFSSSRLTCQAAALTTNLNFDYPVLEIIKNDHVACLTPENQLQILSKVDRKLISAVNVPSLALSSSKSLIWVDHTIFVFAADSSLKVLKFHLMQFVPPTNVN